MLLLITRFLQVVAALLLLRLFLRFVAGVVRGLTSSDAPRTPRDAGQATDMVRDRVCNSFVPKASALAASIDGRQEFFCSAACRDKARALLKAS